MIYAILYSIMIQLRNLQLQFGEQKVFDDISLLLNGHEKIGIVGLNGAGKSTLLKVIANQQEIDGGRVEKSSRITIGYMPQEVVLSSTFSVLDETVGALKNIDEDEIDSIRAEAKKTLLSLGFSEAQLEQAVCDLSVGWRMRVILAQLLMQKADFYLFDEPTNHLDIVTKQWFLQFLKRAPFGFLLVCHEKYFLDNLCDNILELEMAKATMYKGNYSSYKIQKEERTVALKQAYELQNKEITKKQATIDRFKASASRAASAKSMQKQLNKIERIVIPPDLRKVDFNLPPITPSGRVVVTLNKVEHAFGNKKVFDNISFETTKNEKIALVAANGVGKTTLLNIVMGKHPLQTGSIELGYNVIPAYFEQDQVRALEPEKTIFETIQESCPKVTDLAIRSMLGCFLFSKDFIHKKTKVLSGGERNRVSMVRVLLQQANFLMLDEPTNHLDIPSKELLLRALQLYQGTLLFVSHDQDFINNLATHIIELTPHGAYKYEGNYDSYVEQKEFTQQSEAKAPTAKADAKDNAISNKDLFERKKDIRRLEQQIEKADKDINELSLQLGDHDWGTPEYTEVYNRVVMLQKKSDQLLKEWEKLQ